MAISGGELLPALTVVISSDRSAEVELINVVISETEAEPLLKVSLTANCEVELALDFVVNSAWEVLEGLIIVVISVAVVEPLLLIAVN